jgi:hypothetical protein
MRRVAHNEELTPGERKVVWSALADLCANAMRDGDIAIPHDQFPGFRLERVSYDE